MNKNLTLSFNHKAEHTQQAILLNGEPILTPKNAPSLDKFMKTSLFLVEVLDPDFTIEKLAKKLAETDEDGIDLAVSAITCGDMLTEINPEYKIKGGMLLMAHILGNQSISQIVEHTQEVGMKKYVNDDKVDHNEMYTITTLISLIIFGMILAAETKM